MIGKVAVACLVCLVIVESFTPLNIPNYFPPRVQRAGGSSNTVVAFSAGLTNTTQSHTSANLTYDRVFVNGGNGYNNNTGVFTAPLGGTYVFMFHALSQANRSLQLDLYHNSVYIETGYAHAVHDYATSSNAVVLTIGRGDDVYLRSRGETFVYGQPDEVYSTFNGFLLFPTNP